MDRNNLAAGLAEAGNCLCSAQKFGTGTPREIFTREGLRILRQPALAAEYDGTGMLFWDFGEGMRLATAMLKRFQNRNGQA